MTMLCNAYKRLKPLQAGPLSRFFVGFEGGRLTPDMNGPENENTACCRFSQP